MKIQNNNLGWCGAKVYVPKLLIAISCISGALFAAMNENPFTGASHDIKGGIALASGSSAAIIASIRFGQGNTKAAACWAAAAAAGSLPFEFPLRATKTAAMQEKELKNWDSLHEMELRGPNPLLDSLSPQQKGDLCDFLTPVEKILDYKSPMGVILGRLKQLGEGIHAAVYRAEIAGKTFAVKKAFKGSDLEEDFKLGKDLNHPHIVKVWMRVEKISGDYLFLEYLPGDTLANQLKKLKPADALRYASQFTSVCLDLHRIGRVHTDLQSKQNVMISNGTLKLVDTASIPKVRVSIQQSAFEISLLLSQYLITRQPPYSEDEMRLFSYRDRLTACKADDAEALKVLNELAILCKIA